MSSSCRPEPPSVCDGGGGDGDFCDYPDDCDCNAHARYDCDEQAKQLQLQARLERLEVQSPLTGGGGAGVGEVGGGSGGHQTTLLDTGGVGGDSNNIDAEDQPTAKQKRIARVVMAVAFALLAMCVILIAVTLSMSDHIDELVRQALDRSLKRIKSSAFLPSSSTTTSSSSSVPVTVTAGTRD